MRKQTSIPWFLNKGLSTFVVTVLVQSLFLDGPLKAVSDVVGRSLGPLVAVTFLLACGVLVYSAVYFGVTPLLSAYLSEGKGLVKDHASQIWRFHRSIIAYVDEAVHTYKIRKSRSQLMDEIFLLKDTLAERRHLYKRQSNALDHLGRKYAKVVAAYKDLKDDLAVDQGKYQDTVTALDEAKDENIAWDFRVCVLEHELATSKRALETEKKGRSELEEALQTAQRERSEVEGRLQAEIHKRHEAEQSINNAYAEVARAMGLRLDVDSLSSAGKLGRMLQQFQRLRMDALALQGTLESALSDAAVKDAMLLELEDENSALAEAAQDKDKTISALNEEKDQYRREASDKDAEIIWLNRMKDKLVRAGLDKGAIIAKLDEEKAQWLPHALTKDAEIAMLNEANNRLRRELRSKGKMILQLQNDKRCLQGKVDATSRSLSSENSETRAKDQMVIALQQQVHGLLKDVTEQEEVISMLKSQNNNLEEALQSAALHANAKEGMISALHNQVHSLQGNAAEKDEAAITLENRVHTLQDSIDAFRGSIDFAHLESLAKNKTIAKLDDENRTKERRIAVLEDRVDAFRSSLEFVFLEQKAREGALAAGRL